MPYFTFRHDSAGLRPSRTSIRAEHLLLRNGGTFRDQKITVNDDGTLTIIQQFAGNQIISNEFGIIFKDAGVIRQRSVVDYQGTLDNADDDILVEETTPIFQAGPSDTLDRDFCDLLLESTA